jgi:hypothetical protein
MNGKVNIGGDSKDPSYRYKRDIIVIANAGRGMHKISNLSIICKQLKVGDDFVKKFFTVVKGRGIPIFKDNCFRGGVLVKDLEKIMVDLTNKYLLCPTCKLPEWDGASCSACGETKTKKGKKKSKEEDEVEAEEPECPHLKEAAALMKRLYDLRVSALDRSRMDKCIDAFWSFPLCSENSCRPDACEKNYSRWVEIVNKNFFSDE